MAQADDDRTRQGRQIDDPCGFVSLLHVPKHVAKNQTPFGIGIDDLDCVAFHRGHHIARALGQSVRHVFNQTDNAHDVGLCVAFCQCHHRTGHSTRAAHVHGHVFHATCRLQADAACIKHDPFANQCKWRVSFRAAHPFHDDDLRRRGTALTYAQ